MRAPHSFTRCHDDASALCMHCHPSQTLNVFTPPQRCHSPSTSHPRSPFPAPTPCTTTHSPPTTHLPPTQTTTNQPTHPPHPTIPQGLSEPVGAVLALAVLHPFITPERLQYLLACVGGLMVCACVCVDGGWGGREARG